MYEIRPESIKTFITDRNVKLPRFQRKQTWDEKKNFQLCISIFKEYPIGVCILSVEESKGRSIRWLLDGRQRKNALNMMYDDPDNIYIWARKFIGFKNIDQPSEIEEKFQRKISEYIEADLDEDSEIKEEETEKEDSDSNENKMEDTIRSESYGLDFLLDIIKMIHNRQRKNTGFTRPFDFTACVKKLPYLETENGTEKLSSRRVKTFIDEYRKYCDDEDVDYNSPKSFYKFLDSRSDIQDKHKTNVLINEQWNAIKERILIIDKIDTLLTGSKIGMIEVRNLTPSDSQKIFNIINSEGEKLTAVEILSAKPHWNILVENPSQQTINAVRNLYTKIGTTQTDVVRWDLPATLIERIGKNVVLKEFSDSKTDFEKELTCGFKVLTSIYVGGVKKDDIEDLILLDSINWSSDIESLVAELQHMFKLICGFEYFTYFKSWNTSMMDLTSDAIALNFIAIAYKDWLRKDKAIGDTRARKFQKNCFILWDKLIYEYINRQWRGSSDSKIANNIANLDSQPEVFVPVPSEKWQSVLNQIFKESIIESTDVSVTTMKPLLYHLYCLKKIARPETDFGLEVDHIIPQSLFNESTFNRKEAIQHNLLNLGLLPKNENASKGNKRLSQIEIENQWLKDQIVRYEFISEDKFSEYSDVNNYRKMFDERASVFIDAYTTKRDYLLNN